MIAIMFDLDPISPKDGERHYLLQILKTDVSLENATSEMYAQVTSEKKFMPIRVAWKKLSDDLTVENYLDYFFSHSYGLDKKLEDIDKITPQNIKETSGEIMFVRDARKTAREILNSARYNWD